MDPITLLAHVGPWTLALYLGGALLGMALQAWKDRRCAA